MASRRKAQPPRRIESLQHFNEVLAEKSVSAPTSSRGRGGALRGLRFDDDDNEDGSDEELLMGGGLQRRDILSGLDDMEVSSDRDADDDDDHEGPDRGEDDEEEEEETVRRSSRTAGPSTPLGKRSQASLSTRARPSSGKKRKRLFREGRRIELDSEGEEEEQEEEFDLDTFHANLHFLTPLSDPKLRALCRALRLRSFRFELPENNSAAEGWELATSIYRASDTGRRRLEVRHKSGSLRMCWVVCRWSRLTPACCFAVCVSDR